MATQFGPFELNEQTRELLLRGRRVELQPRVFDVLAYLVRHRDRMVGKEELLNTLWPDVIVTDASLQRAISLIRAALREGGFADAIQTRARLGYRFVVDSPETAHPSPVESSDTLPLLERDSALAELTSRHRQSLAGSGKAVFVCGEAGIGKTSLVGAFLMSVPADTIVLRGYCDALFTPRAFGAIQDLAVQLPNGAGLVESGLPRDALFSRLLQCLGQVRPGTILFLEDLHWADEATLDFVRFLVRRIASLPCLLLATYRDEERGVSRLVERALGDLAGAQAIRLRLAPLSAQAVATLARDAGQESERLMRLTGGNPFLVRELLSSPSGGIPESVRDSMLARLTRCSPMARRVGELVAVLPGRAEFELVTQVLGNVAEAVDEAVARGLIEHEAGALAYRHELARLAVENALPPAEGRDLHARLLTALRQRNADVARLVHHARCAGDRASVLTLAPEAARRAAAIGAHREAAAHYAAALAFADEIPGRDRVELLEKHAYECYLTSQFAAAVASASAALALWRELDDRMAQGRMLRFLSRQNWFLGDRAKSERLAVEAIAILSDLPPGHELAMAYSNRSQLAMLKSQADLAIEFGTKAVELARNIGDVEVECHALNNIGTSRLVTGDPAGLALVERSRHMAQTNNLHEHAARAYVNLATSMRQLPVPDLRRYLSEGIAYCEERDLDSWTLYLLAYQARLDLDAGNWEHAEITARRVLDDPIASTVMRIPTLVVRGLLEARRGQPAAAATLDEALTAAIPTEESQRIGAAAAARAEAAWLRHDHNAMKTEIERGLALAEPVRFGWTVGELYFWRARIETVRNIPDWLPGLYQTVLRGGWKKAADAFAQSEMPYERALMLAEGDRAAREEARKIFRQLGAVGIGDR
ncbi:MAG TPA: AAA family ATPase [Candidatus Didemnitutus sp.]|nr:AAA family ATPase [Candidatus Didemnitutus sp.]